MEIKALASKLARYHGTRDPFRIAAALGFIIIDTQLVGIRGYYQYIHRCHIIYLDSGLSEPERRWVCAHELGHYYLHRGLNRIFMDKHTLMATSKYEMEANRFAADLLFVDCDLQCFLDRPIADAAQMMGVPISLAEYRMGSVEPVLYKQKAVRR